MFLEVSGSFKKPKNGIHIINSHFITGEFSKKSDSKIFENFILNLQKYCILISIQAAVELILKNEKPSQPYVALTFDDGFEECATLIAPILDKYNIKAAFFINANYIESNEVYKKEFNKRINTYTKEPMSWSQVKELHNNGHIIGSHGLDHLDFGKISEKTIEEQILKNKKILENKLNYSNDYFAWTYGQFSNFPDKALKITEKYHNIIFSGTDYKNYFSYNDNVINRRHLEPFWNKKQINYFLSVEKK
tara:strand:- start:1393 stop:2139 length:747 start_codon:yes stop_codon:yes gene_type:complete